MRRMSLLSALALTAVAAIPMAGSASASPSLVSTLANAVRSGTAAATFGLRNPCTASVGGRSISLGCTLRVVNAQDTDAPAGYGATELASAYQMPAPTDGPRNTVSIIAVGAYPNAEADLAKYRSTYGLPACTTASGCLSIGDYHGGPPLQPSTAAVEESYATETALDLEMASAGCPTCRINLVQIPVNLVSLLSASLLGLPGALAGDFGTAVNRAAAMGSSAVSMSYGLPTGLEAALLGSGAPAKALDHPGMAIMASSGDKGFTATNQIWPQELPTVTSVGGTTLTKTASGYSHTAWGGMFTPKGGSAEFVGAGSGCATSVGPAVGQPTAVSALCNGHRATSDVSAVADPNTGVAVYDSYTPDTGTGGGWLVVGGTSAASPLIAGFYARGGHLSGVHGPNTMYAAPSGSMLDVTSGSNAQGSSCGTEPRATCVAGTGYDGPTGVGTPQGLGAF